MERETTTKTSPMVAVYKTGGRRVAHLQSRFHRHHWVHDSIRQHSSNATCQDLLTKQVARSLHALAPVREFHLHFLISSQFKRDLSISAASI
ncbi:hypothetical protein Mapa_016112 [Marchantia paleacea]|nr:hypothetical protein Mapa_016112 [Marchantia paleacea]